MPDSFITAEKACAVDVARGRALTYDGSNVQAVATAPFRVSADVVLAGDHSAIYTIGQQFTVECNTTVAVGDYLVPTTAGVLTVGASTNISCLIVDEAKTISAGTDFVTVTYISPHTIA